MRDGAGPGAVLACPITTEGSACGRVRRSVIGWSGRMGSPMSPELHQHRQMAESFGADPERYDRFRSRYPDAMVERTVAASPGLDVLDVGCGTRIAAR